MSQVSTPVDPTKPKRQRIPGLPYERAIQAAFKADLDVLIDENPGVSLTSLYGKFTERFEKRISPGLFRKFLKAIGYTYKRANVIERPGTSAPTGV